MKEEVTCQRKGQPYKETEEISSNENSRCKGPEAEVSLVSFRENKEAELEQSKRGGE